MNITDHLQNMRSELRALLVVTALTLVAAVALLGWGIVSNQAYVVMLGFSIAVVAVGGWLLERSGVKQSMRGMA